MKRVSVGFRLPCLLRSYLAGCISSLCACAHMWACTHCVLKCAQMQMHWIKHESRLPNQMQALYAGNMHVNPYGYLFQHCSTALWQPHVQCTPTCACVHVCVCSAHCIEGTKSKSCVHDDCVCVRVLPSLQPFIRLWVDYEQDCTAFLKATTLSKEERNAREDELLFVRSMPNVLRKHQPLQVCL